jgi:hypothetical protein
MSTHEGNVVLLEVAELLGDQRDRALDADTILRDLTRNVAKFVPGAQFAGITVVERGRIESVAASDDVVRSLDDIARKHQEGPCLAIGQRVRLVQIDDLATENRWPRYRDDAMAGTKIHSILSARLAADTKRIAALTFYAESARAFDDEAVELGIAFAAHTALVLNIVRRGEQFRCALASRDIIGQAKGMVMERFNVDARQAFELLKRLSQTSNVPVAEIAKQLVYADHPPR